MLLMHANGPAVCFSRRNPTTAPSRIQYPAPAGPESCHGARRVWRGFWHPGTNFCEGYACRGTMLIEAKRLSPVTKLVGTTGAVSRRRPWPKRSERHGVQSLLRADVRIRMQEPLQICLEGRS